MANALDRCRRLAEPHQLADPTVGLAGAVQFVAGDLGRLDALLPGHDLDLVAVGLREPHALAAARLVDRLDVRRARQLGDALEVVLVCGVVGEADEAGAALLGDMQMVVVVGAAHVECGRRALGADQPEMGEEFLHFVKVGRFHAGIGEFRSLDDGHCFLRSFGGTLTP